MQHPIWCSGSSRNIVVLSLLLLMIASSSSAQSSAITLPQNLSELVAQSPIVVQGWITQVALVPHATFKNLVTVAVTIQVESALKGTPAGTYTFRQAVIDIRDQERTMGYQAGQHVLLLLIQPNAYGLSSPAGLDQGRFRIVSGPRGNLVAVNGVGNAGLFRGLPSELQQNSAVTPRMRSLFSKSNPGPLDLSELKTVIRTIASMK